MLRSGALVLPSHFVTPLHCVTMDVLHVVCLGLSSFFSCLKTMEAIRHSSIEEARYQDILRALDRIDNVLSDILDQLESLADNESDESDMDEEPPVEELKLTQ